MSEPAQPPTEQQQRERDQFDAFRSVTGLLTGCECHPCNPPEPDIVADTPEGRIGLEFTEIQPSAEIDPNGAINPEETAEEQRVREGEQDVLISMAREVYNARGLQPATVFIEWAHTPRLSKARRNQNAQLLADIVQAHHPAGPGAPCYVGDGESETRIHPQLPIRGIAIHWASSAAAADWQDGSMHRVQPPNPDLLQSRLRKEEPKLTRYKERYAAHWLVLVAGWAGPASWTTLGATLGGVVFDSGYHRVFVLIGRRCCVALPLQPGEALRRWGTC